MLSVVIITLNEAANIGRCLESIHDISTEIIIVDSGSTDKTRQVAEKYKVTWVEHPFKGHVEQKNYALSLATQPWVLSLDADEALDVDLKVEITKLLNQGRADAYKLKRLNQYCGKWIRHGTWYPDKRVRLVKNGKAKWGGHNPHDQLIPVDGVNIQELKGHILHYTIQNLHQHIHQVNYFSSLAAQSKFDSGVRFSWVKLIFNPFWRFLKEFIFKRGFLDGYHGFQIAVMAGYAGFLRYAKLKELWEQEKSK